MNLYTSYFAKSSGHPNAVCIAQQVPKWYCGRVNPILAPTWAMINGIKNGTMSEAEYTSRYIAKLDELGEEYILRGLTDGDVLLCYERPERFCHRHILANWLNSKGHNVKELEV